MNKLVYFLAAILMLSMVAMGAYIWQNEQDKKALLQQIEAVPDPTPVVIPSTFEGEETITPTSTSSADPTTAGTITGSISFPSEAIPEMEVCAEDTTSKELTCTTELLEDATYTNGIGYRLDLPAGTYTVYAKLPNDSYKAYYSEFVTCGLNVSCPSHKPIAISVKTGETVTGVDPQDWYNQ